MLNLNNQITKKSQGVSLLELFLVLGIMALILVGSLSYLGNTFDNTKTTKALQDIRVIRQAASEWVMGQPDYAGGNVDSSGIIKPDICAKAYSASTTNPCISLAYLYQAGDLPDDVANVVGNGINVDNPSTFGSAGTNASPWGTSYHIAPLNLLNDNVPTQQIGITISIDNVPKASCKRLIAALQNQTYAPPTCGSDGKSFSAIFR